MRDQKETWGLTGCGAVKTMHVPEHLQHLAAVGKMEVGSGSWPGNVVLHFPTFCSDFSRRVRASPRDSRDSGECGPLTQV